MRCLLRGVIKEEKSQVEESQLSCPLREERQEEESMPVELLATWSK
jgi:hypothetical protein